jgi:predicted nucleic acid-binding protein
MGDADILIASIACIGNFIVVTNNILHFNFIQEVIPDLRIENWLD